MKEWFKARNVWGAAIRSLSDEDAGRLAKAIWAYTMDGEIVDIEGAGQGVLAMVWMTLQQDDERDAELSEKRAEAGSAGGRQKQANVANATKCKQNVANVANATNKNKNKNKNQNQIEEQESESFIDVDDAHAIQTEQDIVLNAAEGAGFARNDATRAQLIKMYAENGFQKMIDGIESCTMHGAPNLAYLKAVLKGEPRKAKADVNAQKYTQRDYSNEQEEAMMRMIRGAV